MYGGSMIGMWWSWVFIVVLIGAGIWLVARVSSQSNAHSHTTGSERSPEDVLRDRLAHGEIDENEYRSRMHALQHR